MTLRGGRAYNAGNAEKAVSAVRRREIALWMLAILLAAAAGVLFVRVAVFPPRGAVAGAQPAMEPPMAGGPAEVPINDLVMSGRPVQPELPWIESGRNSEVTAGTPEGLKVYNLREYQNKYTVTELQRGAAEEEGEERPPTQPY